MRIKDVPQFPAYLVWHDAFDDGAMDVYPMTDICIAQDTAEKRNRKDEEMWNDDAGFWKAYTKLPRIRVYKVH